MSCFTIKNISDSLVFFTTLPLVLYFYSTLCNGTETKISILPDKKTYITRYQYNNRNTIDDINYQYFKYYTVPKEELDLFTYNKVVNNLTISNEDLEYLEIESSVYDSSKDIHKLSVLPQNSYKIPVANNLDLTTFMTNKIQLTTGNKKKSFYPFSLTLRIPYLVRDIILSVPASVFFFCFALFIFVTVSTRKNL